MNEPWKEFPRIWKTEAAFLSYVRGGIRRSLWNRNPIKLQFIAENRIRIPNPVKANAKRFPEVWGGRCYICEKLFAMKDIEVDHLTGESSLRKLADLQTFVEAIVCTTKSNLGLICKTCHKAKTYAERSGMCIEDAIVEKEAIAIQKGDDKAWLASKGVKPAGNAKSRRVQIIDKLKESVK